MGGLQDGGTRRRLSRCFRFRTTIPSRRLQIYDSQGSRSSIVSHFCPFKPFSLLYMLLLGTLDNGLRP